MAGYAMRREPRARPSEDQRRFLELLRDLGPRDNAQTAAVRKSTKRACQVRGWIEWRFLDNFSAAKAWHLTVAGRKALNRWARRHDIQDPAQSTVCLASKRLPACWGKNTVPGKEAHVPRAADD